MTQSNPSAGAFTAGFQFMRRLREPEFRAFLKRHGWEPGQHVVMATDNEPVIEVMAKMILHDTGGQAMVAIADESRQFGFRLLSFGVAPPRRWRILRRRVEAIPVAPDASIGMLYEALNRCGEYVPSEWSTPVIVRKEPEPA